MWHFVNFDSLIRAVFPMSPHRPGKRSISFALIEIVTISTIFWGRADCSVKCTNDSICELTGEKSLRFSIVGDWGGTDDPPYTSPIQREVAALINDQSKTLRPNFFISTGDNFYERGVKHVNDKRFQKTFDEVYTYGKAENIPWYISLGNHDHYRDAYAQVLYTEKNPRWVFPDYYYAVRYALPDLDVTVEIYVLDTWVYCDKFGRENTPEIEEEAKESLEWLEDGLKKSTATYIFAVGHYSIYSSGHHGGYPCMSPIGNLLIKYNATAYLGGHDHILEHLTMTSQSNWTVHLVTSGAASKLTKTSTLTNTAIKPRSTDWPKVNSTFFHTRNQNEHRGGYVFAELDDKEAVFKYYRSDGTELYQISAPKRKETQVTSSKHHKSTTITERKETTRTTQEKSTTVTQERKVSTTVERKESTRTTQFSASTHKATEATSYQTTDAGQSQSSATFLYLIAAVAVPRFY